MLENPKGVILSSAVTFVITSSWEQIAEEGDSFLGSDKIELIYDNNKPNEIQFM